VSDNILLQMEHIRKEFPGVVALRDVSLELHAGEVHALLGENGAGKSTLIKVLGGIYIAESGNIRIDGKPVTITTVQDAQNNGIAVIHQELVLVPHMTVAENIFLGREPVTRRNIVDFKKMNSDAKGILDSFELNIAPDEEVSRLGIADQQMVEIIKALSANSRILVMDEPTSSLSEKDVGFLFDTIRKLKNRGVGIIYISHRMSELRQITDRITVIRDGEYIGTRDTATATNDELISMMVGRQLTNYYTRDYGTPTETVLEVRNLSDGKLLNNVSFELKKRRSSGVCGPGRGRTQRGYEVHFWNRSLYKGRNSCRGKTSQYT